MVAGKGSSAVPILLAAASELSGRIVTNDRYRDRTEKHRDVGTPGYLVKGDFGDKGLWLDLDARP